jgi:hypothetical protein
MKITVSVACALLLLGPWDTPGCASKKATPRSARKIPAGVRELTFDISKSERKKMGPSVAVCTTREQLELELGQEVGKAIWGKIDPKKEGVVVLGIWDTWSLPKYDGFLIRKVKAEGLTTLRFKYDFCCDDTFLFFLGVEWPTRCKAYAIPRGAAVALD